MKVNVGAQIDISDDQRMALARLLDGEGKRKRWATRQEIKDYAWTHGSAWAEALAAGLAEPLLATSPTEDVDDLLGGSESVEEDLLGAGTDDLLGDVEGDADDVDGSDLL